MAKNLVRRIFSRLGYGIYNLKVPLAKNYLGNFPVDFDSFDIELYRFVKPFTMTSPERIYALRKSVEYILTHNI